MASGTRELHVPGRSQTPENGRVVLGKRGRSRSSSRSTSGRRQYTHPTDTNEDDVVSPSRLLEDHRPKSRRLSVTSAQSHRPADSLKGERNSRRIEEEISPYCNVPGLWFFKAGLDSIDVLECNFEIDQAAAEKWNIPSKNAEETLKRKPESSNISLQILSLPIHLVQKVMKTLGSKPSPESVAHSLSKIPLEWPPTGNLIIEVNPGKVWGKTWLPQKLGDSCPPVELNTCVRQGANVVHFIQLSKMSQYMFVLFASESPQPMASAPSSNFSDLDRLLANLGNRYSSNVTDLGIMPAKVEILL
ncbi:hypothetical protein BDQ17DRAFT_1424979 [Cyathus striatus]|nr:hypothetical protein BDQ17DRAFT_1424979 [Cyathus striatus]